MTIEATGNPDKLSALLAALEPFGIREIVKSGTVGDRPRLALDHRPGARARPALGLTHFMHDLNDTHV